jgi:hypothetical protein
MNSVIISPTGESKLTDLQVIEVLEFRVGGERVVPGQAFPAGSDWLRNLSVRVRNISTKPISYLSMSFIVPAARFTENGRDYQMTYSVAHGEENTKKDGEPKTKAILPGEEAELVCSAWMDRVLMQDIEKKAGIKDIAEIKTGSIKAIFTDGDNFNGSMSEVGGGVARKN